MEDQVELDFNQLNALINRKSPSHKIGGLKKPEKNIELKFIIVSKVSSFKTKKDLITQCDIADETGAISINFFNDTGIILEEGDICYINGAYSSFYKDKLVLYEGQSMIRKIGKWFMNFSLMRTQEIGSDMNNK